MLEDERAIEQLENEIMLEFDLDSLSGGPLFETHAKEDKERELGMVELHDEMNGTNNAPLLVEDYSPSLPPPSNCIQSLEPGPYINRAVIEFMLNEHKVNWADSQSILGTGKFPRSVRQAHGSSVGVLVHHSNHFLAAVVSPTTKLMCVFDSLPDFKVEERGRVLSQLAARFGKEWSVARSW